MRQNFEDIRQGTRLVVDWDIILLASSQRSRQCVSLVRRIAEGIVEGVITTVVLGELCQRWMMEEARAKRIITGPNLLPRIANSPGVIQQLTDYHQLTTAMVHGAMQIESVTREDFIASLQIQRRWGLMPNDSLLIAVGERLGIQAVASTNQSFHDLQGWLAYCPDDLPPSRTRQPTFLD